MPTEEVSLSLRALASSRSSSRCDGGRWAGRTVVSLLAVAAVAAPATPALAATDTTPPAPVTGLVTSADKTRAKLDWTGNTEKDLAGYLVYRAASAGGDFVRLTSTPVTSSEYSDYAAPAGLPSYYRIAAVDTSGNQSTPVSATVTRKDGTAPAAPKALSAARDDNGISLSWADNSEADLAGYVVSRATTSGGTYTKLTSKPITASSFRDATASSTVNYYYKVTATDFSGNSSSAASVAALLPDTSAPAAVRSMVVTASTTGIKLDWASNSESDLAGYQVYRSSSADGTYTRLTATPRTSSDYTDGTAPVGVTSYYKVTAVDKTGNESVPVAATGVRKDGVAPAAPTGLTATWTTSGVTLDWADSLESDLAGYVVSRATTSGGTYTKLTATPKTGSSYVDTTAPAGASTYYYKVSAVDRSGNTSAAASTTA